MSTLNELIDSVQSTLHGYAQDQEQYASLYAPAGAADLTLTVSAETAGEISRGLIEVDDELMLVQKVSQSDGIVTLLPGGRGFRSVAATHSAGALVTNNPKFPRVHTQRAINDTIKGLYPDLYQVATTEITKQSGVYSYQLPADVGNVLTVHGSLVGPSRIWSAAKRWQFHPSANTTTFPTGKALDVLDELVPGQTFRVVYAKAPQALSNGADDFSTTGLPDSCEDLIGFGACYRLLPAYESARLQQDAIEASERAQNVPPGSAIGLSRYFYTLYQQRLIEERNRIQRLNPFTVHFIR